jgi:hypothetical protein
MSARLVALVLSLGAVGCAGDLGVGGGAMTKTGHAVVFGRSSLSTRIGGVPMGDHGVLVGLALEGRGEQRVGSRFDAGVLLGGGTSPYALADCFGFEGYAELGTPLRGTLFEHGDKYYGLGFGLPIPLHHRRDVARVNDSLWILKYRLEVGPFARTHLYDLHDDHLPLAVEVSGGIAFRYRLVSDLF